jgi:hypothetical protein
VPQPRTKATMSLIGSNCSSFSRMRSQDCKDQHRRHIPGKKIRLRRVGTPTHAIILNAHLGHRVRIRPNDILDQSQAVLFEILHMLFPDQQHSSSTAPGGHESQLNCRSTHVAEPLPLHLPFLRCLLIDPYELPELLLVLPDRLADFLELHLELLGFFALRKRLVCGV